MRKLTRNIKKRKNNKYKKEYENIKKEIVIMKICKA